MASEWVRLEAHHGKQRRILIPAKIDDVEPPFAFQMIQAASLVDWRGEWDHAELAELLREVESLVPRRVQAAAADPVPTAAPVKPVPPPGYPVRPEPTPEFPADSVPKKKAVRVWAGRIAGVGLAAAGVVAVVWLSVFEFPRSPKSGVSPGTTKRNPKDGLEYVWIPPGQFQMGCSPGDKECYNQEKPAHPVTITRGFWMGRTEVTEAAYNRSVGYSVGSGQMPMVNVSWGEAKTYCEWAGLRLPTEAEWEYAARAGTTEARYGAVDSVAWHSGNSGGKLHPVAGRRPNAWGLYDMLGNAWEWVQDWHEGGYDEGSPSADPPGPRSGTDRSVRGASWSSSPGSVRVSVRYGNGPAGRDFSLGFRCSGELR